MASKTSQLPLLDAKQAALSAFLSSLDDNLLRQIVSYWIGVSDEEDEFQRSLTTRESVCRWVLASLYAEKVESIAKTHYNFDLVRRPAAERCLCNGCSEMPDCVDLRTRIDVDDNDNVVAQADDYFVRISYRHIDRRSHPSGRPSASQVCQGFVTEKPKVFRLLIPFVFTFSLKGIYDEVVDQEWPEMENLLGFDARNQSIRGDDDDALRRSLKNHVSKALKSLSITVVAIERSARPWRCRLVVASGGYFHHTIDTESGALYGAYFQLRGIRSHDPPVGENRVIPAIGLGGGTGKLIDLTIKYEFGGAVARGAGL